MSVSFLLRRTPPSLLSILLTTGVAMALFGCSGPSTATAPTALPETFPNHSADEIRSLIGTPTDTLNRFAADARVNVQSPEQNRSFNASIHHRRADSLLMRFSLFGMEGGRMLLTPDSVFMYDSRKHTLQAGPVSKARDLFPVPVGSGKVFENLLGLIAHGNDDSWSIDADSSLYYLSNSKETEQWTVDPRQWRVLRYRHTSADGTLIEERRFSNFKTIQGVRLPHHVVFRRPNDNLRATLNYREIRLNPSELSLGLNVPGNISRSPLP